MSNLTYSDDYLRGILGGARVVAVVGASRNPSRPSHEIMEFLIGRGHTVYAINPTLEGRPLLDRPAFDHVTDVPEPIDIVDIFRRSEMAGEVVDQAIAAEAGTVWMQLGVRDDAAAARAEAAGLNVVMDRCIKVEITRLGI